MKSFRWFETMAAIEAGVYAVRPVGRQDIEALVVLCQEHALFERVDYDLTDKLSRLNEALFADRPRMYTWVAAAKEGLIGYATAMPAYSTWAAREYFHMDCLFVRTGSRGKGVGAALLNEVVQYALRHDCAEVQWQTPDWNIDAIRFYRRCGAVAQQKLRFTLRGAISASPPAPECKSALDSVTVSFPHVA